MNIAANIKPTPAEEALIERLKAIDTDASRAALALISQTGLPTRRVESWHYTDLRTLLKDVPEQTVPGAMQGDYKKLVDAHRVMIVDGKRDTANAPSVEGVTIETVSGGSVPSKVDDAVTAFGALATEATRITISGDETVTGKPLGLAQVSTGNGLSATHFQVTVRAGADVEVIDRHYSQNSLSPLNANVVDLELEAGAKCHWFIVQQESEDATRLARMNVTLAEDSDLTLFVVNAGGKLVRQEIFVQVNGENANITMKGVNLVGEGAHVDVTTLLAHNVPNTTAEEIFRNVVTGSGKGVFQGQIKVAQPAQKTDAQMACNTLLLTDDADFSAKPELEIFADDVICAHGATVTDIEDDHLFYLKARGIDDKTARNMLVKAFVDEIVEDLDDELLEEALTKIIDDWLDTHA